MFNAKKQIRFQQYENSFVSVTTVDVLYFRSEKWVIKNVYLHLIALTEQIAIFKYLEKILFLRNYGITVNDSLLAIYHIYIGIELKLLSVFLY